MPEPNRTMPELLRQRLCWFLWQGCKGTKGNKVTERTHTNRQRAARNRPTWMLGLCLLHGEIPCRGGKDSERDSAKNGNYTRLNDSKGCVYRKGEPLANQSNCKRQDETRPSEYKQTSGSVRQGASQTTYALGCLIKTPKNHERKYKRTAPDA